MGVYFVRTRIDGIDGFKIVHCKEHPGEHTRCDQYHNGPGAKMMRTRARNRAKRKSKR